jgi:hypothetical protein
VLSFFLFFLHYSLFPSLLACVSLWVGPKIFFQCKKKNVKSTRNFLVVSLNPTKQVNFKTSQSDYLLSSSFKLNWVRDNMTWIDLFHGSKGTNSILRCFFKTLITCKTRERGQPAIPVNKCMGFLNFNNMVFSKIVFLAIW